MLKRLDVSVDREQIVRQCAIILSLELELYGTGIFRNSAAQFIKAAGDVDVFLFPVRAVPFGLQVDIECLPGNVYMLPTDRMTDAKCSWKGASFSLMIILF